MAVIVTFFRRAQFVGLRQSQEIRSPCCRLGHKIDAARVVAIDRQRRQKEFIRWPFSAIWPHADGLGKDFGLFLSLGLARLLQLEVRLCLARQLVWAEAGAVYERVTGRELATFELGSTALTFLTLLLICKSFHFDY